MLLCYSVAKQSEYLFGARGTVSRSLLSLTGFTPESACKASSYTGVFRKAVVSSPHSHSSLGQHIFARLEGERPSMLSQKTIKSRNEADQDRFLHTRANTTSQITLMPCARSLSFQAVSLRSAPSPPFFWCDRGERVSPDAC